MYCRHSGPGDHNDHTHVQPGSFGLVGPGGVVGPVGGLVGAVVPGSVGPVVVGVLVGAVGIVVPGSVGTSVVDVVGVVGVVGSLVGSVG